ncbi:MAG: O-methyltransferase [Firmicutes bacterium]|nr:O-methyltransferase [Bacillota bacterium]
MNENYLIDNELFKYILNLYPKLEGKLGELRKKALEEDMPVITDDVVRLMGFLLRLIKPCNILEIGTCVGFSAIYMSGFLKEGGHITTIDRYPYMIERAKENIADFGLTDKITLLEGDANDILPRLAKEGHKYDFIFMDAAKGQYINLLSYVIRLCKKDGVIVADDIFQNGTVAKKWEDIPHRQKTIYSRLNEFLYAITHNESLYTSILTLSDGIALMQKISE